MRTKNMRASEVGPAGGAARESAGVRSGSGGGASEALTPRTRQTLAAASAFTRLVRRDTVREAVFLCSR
ncbi:hypothetical protein L0M97_14475, partial [[Ruminococcus] torques]|uniref:hypothetical protein n=1 Tax=[Ruminococcus] torques TaxID=33039 RepID=UPI001EDE0388